MRTILSADLMTKIPNAVIKELAKAAGVNVSSDAAAAISKLLEEKAKEIATFAVENAKKRKRSTVMEEDVDAYRLSGNGK
jgi:histone H3/H4